MRVDVCLCKENEVRNQNPGLSSFHTEPCPLVTVAVTSMAPRNLCKILFPSSAHDRLNIPYQQKRRSEGKPENKRNKVISEHECPRLMLLASLAPSVAVANKALNPTCCHHSTRGLGSLFIAPTPTLPSYLIFLFSRNPQEDTDTQCGISSVVSVRYQQISTP